MAYGFKCRSQRAAACKHGSHILAIIDASSVLGNALAIPVCWVCGATIKISARSAAAHAAAARPGEWMPSSFVIKISGFI